ncbi:7-cyano-7-deazaguanine synthase QueC [Helicobacter trogontum]|uniref:7-cyano-7-deazaguanine synthase n=1 Tax=Helicobacter trogontum TaxID=50960 RepID=A0ABQ0D3V0_9HELI
MRLVLLSGGVDSTTALFWSKKTCNTHALIFKYPSLHNQKEINCAMQICRDENIPYTLLDISSVFTDFKSALLQNNTETIPNDSYNLESMSKLVIPFRNGIFLSIAAGLAESLGCTEVVLSNHAGDHPIYPDCTKAFITSMNESIFQGSGGLVKLCSPFCGWDKNEIVRLGVTLGIDYAKTYSCYKGGERHCNVCPTCIESNESFLANGIVVDR